MRPIDRGHHPVGPEQEPIAIQEYADARPHLEARLGRFCSYCGMRLDSGLHVEHVRPKSLRADLERQWDNLLIACVNCNSTKGDEDVDLASYVWPDVDNPLTVIEYTPHPRVRAGLSADLHAKVKRTLELTGLDHRPTRAQQRKNSDKRFLARIEAWDKAKRALDRVKAHDSIGLREQVIENAWCDGYWAVWYTVLSEDSDLRRRMVEGHSEYLPGTSRACFDLENRPIERKR